MRATSLQPKLPRVPLAKQGRVAQQRCGLHGCRENSQEQLLEAVGLCLPHAALANLLSLSQSVSVPTCAHRDRKSTRLNSSHLVISYAVFCLKKKKYIELLGDTVQSTSA